MYQALNFIGYLFLGTVFFGAMASQVVKGYFQGFINGFGSTILLLLALFLSYLGIKAYGTSVSTWVQSYLSFVPKIITLIAMASALFGLFSYILMKSTYGLRTFLQNHFHESLPAELDRFLGAISGGFRGLLLGLFAFFVLSFPMSYVTQDPLSLILKRNIANRYGTQETPDLSLSELMALHPSQIFQEAGICKDFQVCQSAYKKLEDFLTEHYHQDKLSPEGKEKFERLHQAAEKHHMQLSTFLRFHNFTKPQKYGGAPY